MMGSSDPVSLEMCNLPEPANNFIDLTKDSHEVSSDLESLVGGSWLHNALYSLTLDNREVLSPPGWLSDSVIAAAYTAGISTLV